jgi:hypothetical protein
MRSLLYWLARWLDRRAIERAGASLASEPEGPDEERERYEPTGADWAEYAEWSRATDRHPDWTCARDYGGACEHCDREDRAQAEALAARHDAEHAQGDGDGDSWYRLMIARAFFPGGA